MGSVRLVVVFGVLGAGCAAGPVSPPEPLDSPPPLSAVRLQETDDTTIARVLSLACADAGGTTENSWYRVFSLRDYGIAGPFAVNRVNFGVQAATGTQRVQVSIGTYAGDVGAEQLDPAKLDALAMTTVAVPPTTIGETLQANFAAVEIPAAANLVVEVRSAGHGTDPSSFYLGATRSAETIPGYLRAPQCATPNPVMTSALGYLSTHLIIAVSGTH